MAVKKRFSEKILYFMRSFIEIEFSSMKISIYFQVNLRWKTYLLYPINHIRLCGYFKKFYLILKMLSAISLKT